MIRNVRALQTRKDGSQHIRKHTDGWKVKDETRKDMELTKHIKKVLKNKGRQKERDETSRNKEPN